MNEENILFIVSQKYLANIAEKIFYNFLFVFVLWSDLVLLCV